MKDTVKAQRSLWLTPRLLNQVGATAHGRMIALGRAAQDEIFGIGDRLASVSVAVAQRYYRRAGSVRARLGADGFRRWVALGEALATEEPMCREGAVAFFAVPVSRFGPGGLDTAAAWCALARELANTSRKLATIFLKTTAAALKQPDGLDRLRAWVSVGLTLYRQRGWHGEFLAQAFFASAPRTLLMLSPELYQVWAGSGAALYPVLKEREFFGGLARELQAWSPAERGTFMRMTLALAATSPRSASVLYRTLPASLRTLSAAVRASLLRVLARCVKQAADLADVAPVAGALLAQVPPARQEEALSLVDRLAASVPEVAIACVKSLPRLYEEASPEQVREWFATGMRLAADNVAARLAFFALESRTSVKVLRATSTAVTLEECQGLLRKYIQMLSGEPVSIRGIGEIGLRSPLEEFPAENEVALPLRIDVLESHEDNLRLYRFLAAQLAGRREYGTYTFVPPGGPLDPASPRGSALRCYLDQPEQPELLEPLFLLTEGVRIHACLCAEYGGIAPEGKWVGARMLARIERDAAVDHEHVLDGLYALSIAGVDSQRPAWLPSDVALLFERLTTPLRHPAATVDDSMRVAHALAAALAMPSAGRVRGELGGEALMLERIAGETMLDPYEGDESSVPDATAVHAPAASGVDEERAAEEVRLKLSEEPDEGSSGGRPMSLEELQRLLQSGVDLKITQGAGNDLDGLGLYISDLLGKIPSEQLEQLRALLGTGEERSGRIPRRWFGDGVSEESYFYDEWDYHIGDYRGRWCQLREITLEGDSGDFYAQALTEYARLIPEVRRQFQRIRPEMYRTVRGLEDGEDFDLNAVINALVEGRAGRPPSSKLYVARKREERDVATLFLVDMSASTDEPLTPAPPASTSTDGPRPPTKLSAHPRGRRIIDVTKAALVVMAAALEEIGDAYAIYGFSGHGREQVEFYRVKSFAEALSPTVKGRVGGIEPKRSTRMGTALRHAIEKMTAVNSRSKHLFLLSDGFPQDYDYGQDRRSNVYGIRDTAVALREAETAGITPFCITVDKAGHDYLRQMCDESRYMVIEDIAALPRELPKIYQRVVRA